MSSIKINFEEVKATLSDVKNKTAAVDASPIENGISQSAMPSLTSLTELEGEIDHCIEQLTTLLTQLERDAQASVDSMRESDETLSQGIQIAAAGVNRL